MVSLQPVETKVGKSRNLCKFGVISDIQYADEPDGTNFDGTRNRYYRNALNHLSTAVKTWKTEDVEFAMDLGDVIDVIGKQVNQSVENLNKVLDVYDELGKPVYYQWGNHDYYNFSRKELFQHKRFCSVLREDVSSSGEPYAAYYQFSPCSGFRIVVLDMYEVSILGLEGDSPNFKLAYEWLKSVNPNEGFNSPKGMPADLVQITKYNGAVSEAQLQWLENVLNEADKNRERALVSGHLPVFEPSSDAYCLAWNHDKILKLFHAHPCVTAYFCGHDHRGGFGIDKAGIHHITFPGVLETDADDKAFAVIDVDGAGLTVKGFGKSVPDRNIPYQRRFV